VTYHRDLELEHTLDVGSSEDNLVQVWWRSAICLVEEGFAQKVYRRMTDATPLH